MNLLALPPLSFEVEEAEPILSDRAYKHTEQTVAGLRRSGNPRPRRLCWTRRFPSPSQEQYEIARTRVNVALRIARWKPRPGSALVAAAAARLDLARDQAEQLARHGHHVFLGEAALAQLAVDGLREDAEGARIVRGEAEARDQTRRFCLMRAALPRRARR